MTTSPSHDPLVTVCIPSYNHARFIADTIQSIIDQTYRNIELIIIDDGSKDKSLEVIDKFREACQQRFTRFEIRSRPNKGLGATLNEGLEWAQGEYFSAIASDDIALPQKTEVLLREIAHHPAVAGVFGGVEMINDRREVAGSRAAKGEWGFSDIFLGNAVLMAPASFLRVNVLRAAGGFDTQTIIEDWSTWLKLTETGKFKLKAVPSLVAMYRLHGANTHTRVAAMQEARTTIINRYQSHPLYRRAQAASISTTAIALAEKSPWQSISYILKSRGAPVESRMHAIIKVVLPAPAFSAIRRIYWNMRRS